MKSIRILFLFLFILNVNFICQGQIKPMGFTQEVICPVPNRPYDMYYPRIKIINDTLFVCSNTGIYQKDLKHDSDWELFAFEGVAVNEFIKKGSEILAISPGGKNQRDSLLLFSQDNGKTYIDYTPSFLFEEGNNNHLQRITQNPENPNSVFLVSRDEVSISYDYGENWQDFYRRGFFNLPSISYLPSDTLSIFYAGEIGTQESKIRHSYDGGETWSEYLVPGGDNCVHHIAFHPVNPDILVFSGEGIIGKSIDKGKTWNILEVHDWAYLYKIVFDEENPSIIYTSSSKFGGNDDKFYLYRSTDEGETWEVAYEENLDYDWGGVMDILLYENRLIFYTWKSGLLELDINSIPTVSILPVRDTPKLTITQNPAYHTLYFETNEIITRVEITDMTGKLVQQTNSTGMEKTINVSRLNTGIYLATFYTDNNQMITKRISVIQ